MYGEGNMGGGFRPRGGPGGFAPVKVGEELDVRIEAVGEKGDGIARKRGFVLFVPNTREGDEVRIKVTKVLRKVGFADVVGEAQSTPPADDGPAPRREEQQVAQPLPPEPAPEDTEDFGEETEETPAEEPAEEPAAEESAPEPEASADEPAEEPASDDLEAPPLPDAPDPEDADEEKKEE